MLAPPEICPECNRRDLELVEPRDGITAECRCGFAWRPNQEAATKALQHAVDAWTRLPPQVCETGKAGVQKARAALNDKETT